MMNPDGSPNTQHSTNLVPLIVMDKEKNWHLKPGKLGDMAPSILTAMEISVPEVMNGNVLIS
jgi:2,3-bisphosphoglycerate-independent phosphoglycerate mutase